MLDLPPRLPNGPILHAIADLDEPAIVAEEIHHLPGARVVLADYDALQHDFPILRTEALERHNPELRDARGPNRDAHVRAIIDAWLLANAAFVSAAQVPGSAVNRRLEVDGSTTGYRPPMYGRGVVASIRENSRVARERRWRWEVADGLLDLKGVGVALGRVPSHDEHCSGVEYLGVALSDFLLKRVIDEIFRRASPAFATLPVYAVLDLGFHVLDGWHGTAAAGLHVRRAHRRPPQGMMLPRSGSAEEGIKFEMEMLLRSYGLTSTARATSLAIQRHADCVEVKQGGTEPLDVGADAISWLRALRLDGPEIWLGRVNIQLTRETCTDASTAQLFDFGHINVKRRFLHPVCSAVRDRPLCLGGVIFPEDDAYVQPDPRVCLSADEWDRSLINDLGFDLATMFGAGAITRNELRLRLEAPIRAVVEKWVLCGAC